MGAPAQDPAVEARDEDDADRVLIVDDYPDTRDLMIEALGLMGLAVDGVGDARTALERVATAPPDVIVTDITLPDMSGLALCKAIRENPLTASIPVIVVTGHVGLREEAFGAGASGFLAKPVTTDDVLRAIDEVLDDPLDHASGEQRSEGTPED